MYNRYLRARGEPPEPGAPLPPPPPKPGGLNLPGKLETGDLILILILFLIWLEKEDEEILILLSALVVMSL